MQGQAEPYAAIRMYGRARVGQADAQGFLFSPGPLSIRVDAHGSLDSLRFDPSSWRQSVRVIIAADTAAQADSLLNFSVPIRLNTSLFASIQAVRGMRYLRIADTKNHELLYSVDEWNSTAELAVLWVSVPIVHPRVGDMLYVMWDKPGLAAELVPAAPDSLYGLWHLGGIDPFAEASGLRSKIAQDSGTLSAQGLLGFGRLFHGHDLERILPPTP